MVISIDRFSTEVNIFFNLSASFVDEFTERLNKESNIQMLYNTDRYSNEGELLQLLKELYTDLADHHINFTILCNSENTRMLLKLVKFILGLL